MKKSKLFIAFIIALVLILLTVATGVVSRLLDLLPEPWNIIANVTMLLALTTLFIYILIPANQSSGEDVHDPDCPCQNKQSEK